MNVAYYAISHLALASGVWNRKPDSSASAVTLSNAAPFREKQPKDPFDLLLPLRQWLDHTEVTSPKMARMLCKFIPSQCPFERKITLLGYTLIHIPPLCKLNPLYEQVVGLRFRALCYLADVCGEDITSYC